MNIPADLGYYPTTLQWNEVASQERFETDSLRTTL